MEENKETQKQNPSPIPSQEMGNPDFANGRGNDPRARGAESSAQMIMGNCGNN